MGLEVEKLAPAHVKPTQRLTPLLLLAVAVIVVSTFAEPGALYAGISLLLLLAAMRGYAVLATLALSRAYVYCDVRGNVEGRPVEIIVRISNKSFIPVAFAELSFSYSPNLRLARGVRAALCLVPPRGVVEYRVAFLGRVGRHVVGPLKAVVRDPLGVFRSDEIVVMQPIYVSIVPRGSEVIVRKLWVETRSTGITRAREAGTGVEFYGIREYRPGDDIKRIVWRHLAIAGKLTVKETERESFQSILFVVDATPQMFMGPYGESPFEHAARVVTSIAGYLAKRGDLMTLLIFGKDIVFSGTMSRGRQAYLKILKTFANIPFPTEPSDEIDRDLAFQKALRVSLELLPRERNLVFLFTMVRHRGHLESIVKYVNKLRVLGNEVYVAIPITAAYEVRGLPPWAQAIYRIKMFEQVKEELRYARMLRRYGVKVLALGPELLPETIVRIIETSRTR